MFRYGARCFVPLSLEGKRLNTAVAPLLGSPLGAIIKRVFGANASAVKPKLLLVACGWGTLRVRARKFQSSYVFCRPFFFFLIEGEFMNVLLVVTLEKVYSGFFL